ncbi:MAG: recombinase zinc beta ribbon domain-containing protein [Pirellulales bacterium]|nr:recombinase zinc beta ribbon domain-containing protein [Pirellulales bacterium]
MIPERSEARRVKAIFERAARGETPRQIADHANRYGWRTKIVVSLKTGIRRGGNRWTPRQVLDTLANVTYLGLVRCGNELYPGSHAPIVAQELFEQAAAQIASRRHACSPRDPANRIVFPLRGKLICGLCGRAMSPTVSHYGNRRYRYYRCRSHAGGKSPCIGSTVPAEEIERSASDLIADVDGAGDLDNLAERQSLAEAWTTLPDQVRRRQIAQIVERAVFDIRHCRLIVSIVPGAAEHVQNLRSSL